MRIPERRMALRTAQRTIIHKMFNMNEAAQNTAAAIREPKNREKGSNAYQEEKSSLRKTTSRDSLPFAYLPTHSYLKRSVKLQKCFN